MSLQAALLEPLRALGATADLAAVHSLYAPLLAAQPREGVVLLSDRAYGGHEHQRLDIYTPETGERHPVLVWVHGGGFIRGDKQHRANIGYWGARQGFVTVLPNYRLAPQHGWPSGAEDVVAVWQWLQEHVASSGGAPDRVVLAGESAGAAHVAAATLMRRFQPAHWRIAGAALLSGPYNPALEGGARQQLGIATPDPRNDAYYGSDPRGWDAASVARHVDAAPFPVWLGLAERDLLQMQVQAGELFARLVCDHGFAPQLHMLREHNHFSGGYSVGTGDHSLSGPLAAFVRSCVADSGGEPRLSNA